MRRKLSPRIALAALFACGSIAASCVIAADPPAAAGNADAKKLAVALSPTIQLLQLMDTDKNGKVSKEEFLRFMTAEFEFADKNHDDELDPKELRHLLQGLHHPVEGPGR